LRSGNLSLQSLDLVLFCLNLSKKSLNLGQIGYLAKVKKKWLEKAGVQNGLHQNTIYQGF